jgi:cytochrome P450
MTATVEAVATRALTLPEELILMLLNEESGHFRQVPGWDLDCAVVGSVLAELSMRGRIDTDMTSLILLNAEPTGDSIIDPILEAIASEPGQRNAQYWIERLAPRAENIIDRTIDRLVRIDVLQHHAGDFWTLAETAWQTDSANGSDAGSAAGFVKNRISQAIFTEEIPEPRDIIIICLVNTCDLFRFIFQLEEEHEQRIELICKMDLIGRSLAEAVNQNQAGALFQRTPLSKKIPTVPLRKLLFNPQLRNGNLPAVFADVAKEYGPVFQLHPPLSQPLYFAAGPQVNRWANRYGRGFLRAQDYLSTFEKIYGAHGILPALDGADHFRLRKAMSPALSRQRLESQLDGLYQYAREEMGTWQVGEAQPASQMIRRLINAEISRLHLNIYSQDIIDDLIEYKEQALSTHVVRALPKFLLKTPGMRRKSKVIGELLNRVMSVHTPAQRSGCPRDLADDLLSLHASDPQFLPASNLSFALSAALLASMYLGDLVNFTVYAMASQPELHERVRAEADALFKNGDPASSDFTMESIDVTHRLMMETLRMYPIVPMSIRTAMNPFVLEGYPIPTGTRIHFAQTACHYMEDVFPDPYKFDIDRYKAPRNEHRGPGFAPYGLGAHSCLGQHMLELQLAVNVLMIAHHFELEVWPRDFKFKINPFPSQSPSKKLKYRLTSLRHPLTA